MTAINAFAWLMLLITCTMVKTAYSFIMAANTQDDVLAFTLGQNENFHNTNGSIMDFKKDIYIMGLSSDFQTSGVFTCPAKGVYKFQVYALTVDGKRLWLELYRNEELVASMYGYTPNTYASAANAVILFLKEEDRIFVKTRDQYDVMLFGKPGQIYATFSGDSAIWLELYHNSDYVCALYGYTPNVYAAAGNTAILNLRLGDVVQVKARGTNKLFGEPDQVYSIFSGALISRELPNIPLSSRMIAFSVGLSTSTVVPSNSKVMFDQIFINVKHTYDQRTGDFTAPTDGSYEFNVHALSQKGEPIWLELFHNYKYIVSLHTHDPKEYGSTGNSAVIRLYSDDVVYVKTRYNKQSGLYGRPDEIYCTFSGHLLTSTP